MCEICSKRKADVALFLSEHAPQLGIRSERAQVAWSELNAIAVEITLLPVGTAEQVHAAHEEHSRRMAVVMAGLSLAELEEIFFASTVLWMTGNLHRGGASGILKARWRNGERDPLLGPEAIASLEDAIARDDVNSKLRKDVAAAIAQAFDAGVIESIPTPPKAPSITVLVPGSGKPVPPS